MSSMHSHNHDDHGESHNGKGKNWLFSRAGIATIIAVSVLGFLVYEGHGAHILGYAPFLLILACPLLHIFMHGGHGGHGAHRHGNDDRDEGDKKPMLQQQSSPSTTNNNGKSQHQHRRGDY